MTSRNLRTAAGLADMILDQAINRPSFQTDEQLQEEVGKALKQFEQAAFERGARAMQERSAEFKCKRCQEHRPLTLGNGCHEFDGTWSICTAQDIRSIDPASLANGGRERGGQNDSPKSERMFL